MINSIIKGITNAIYKKFGDDYDIYTEKVEQGLEEPCFFIYCINPNKDIFLGCRMKQNYQFVVQYIPKGPNKKMEINSVFEELNDAVRFIDVGNDKMMATSISSNISDEVLTLSVTYTFFSYEKQEGDLMDEQVIKQEVR